MDVNALISLLSISLCLSLLHLSLKAGNHLDFRRPETYLKAHVAIIEFQNEP
ncbi:hypothetical protein HanIR_Chr02g0059501 [Helianthus annuus]|nr:hypothetical protein HanIR_Chr02g0059501 [Helianthus annuus]